jgi:glycosyltransferase involved in cell wall biosynthesis
MVAAVARQGDAGDRLRVCIDARVDPTRVGGVAAMLIGLAHGLTHLRDGDEEYLFLVPAEGAEWLAPYAGAGRFLRSKVTAIGRFAEPASRRMQLAGAVLHSAREWGTRMPLRPARWPPIPRSDGTVESANVDLIHFVAQNAFLTDVPSIFHPHDLQHVHLPANFASFVRRRRDLEYGTFCRRAAMVAVTSEWVRDDVIGHYGLPEDKVSVVPWAPPTLAYQAPDEEALGAVAARLALPPRFLFYPAQAWPHKNHLALFHALVRLRDEEALTIPLICTGGASSYASELLRQRDALGLAEQVRWLGFVMPDDLRALFELCEGVVVPTLFEAASGPVWEAFLAGAPVACSNVTSLPDQVGDAAIVFDAYDEAALVDAVRRLWLDDSLRSELGRKGRKRVSEFTWERTARHFRAHYRRLAGRELDPADLTLLNGPPLL